MEGKKANGSTTEILAAFSNSLRQNNRENRNISQKPIADKSLLLFKELLQVFLLYELKLKQK